MAHNEKVFLPIWLGYYSKFFAPEDTYVIDHDSTDGSIEQAQKRFKFNLKRVHHNTVHNNDFMLKTIQDMQHKLIKQYDIVAYSDADEILLPDPQHFSDLNDYLHKFSHDYIACESRSVIHQLAEPAIDLTKPVLSQRSVWFREQWYDKVLVSRIALNWTIGLHSPINTRGKPISVPIDDNLILLHLARLDFSLRKQRNDNVAKQKWGAIGDIAKQHQLRGKDLKHWFYHPANLTLIEYIPDRFKALV